MKQSGKSELPRRRFLQQLLVLGGATGAAAIAAQGVHAAATPQRPGHAGATVARNKGYRLTQHIRTYYEKAQI